MVILEVYVSAYVTADPHIIGLYSIYRSIQCNHTNSCKTHWKANAQTVDTKQNLGQASGR